MRVTPARWPSRPRLGAPLRGRRALTALRRREIGLPCCRGSLSVTGRDVPDLTSPAQSASACLCKTLQNASTRCRSLQNPQCKIVQFRAKQCFRMLRNVSFCCVHTCASGPARRACDGSVSAKDGAQARRLLALAAIYDGATRTKAAKMGDVGLQLMALRATSIGRFNAVSVAGGPFGSVVG